MTSVVQSFLQHIHSKYSSKSFTYCRGHTCDDIHRQFLCTSVYLEKQWELYGKVYSRSSLLGTKHAFSFKFILYREPVMTVNVPAQERNATCRIVASLGSLMC